MLDFENLENLIEAPPLSSIDKQLWQYQIACWLISEQLRKFFLSYTKAVNKKANREGSLMRKNFRRKPIDDNSYLKYLIWYIHNNPVHQKNWNSKKGLREFVIEQ